MEEINPEDNVDNNDNIVTPVGEDNLTGLEKRISDLEDIISDSSTSIIRIAITFTTAFGIILEDPNVEGILVIIFGGIIRCDMVARSIIDASREVGLSVPLVVRFSGTNHEEGRDVLEESSLEVTTVGTLADGAEAIVAATVGVDA